MLSCTVKGFMTASWALSFALAPVLVIGHHCIQQTNKQLDTLNSKIHSLFQIFDTDPGWCKNSGGGAAAGGVQLY